MSTISCSVSVRIGGRDWARAVDVAVSQTRPQSNSPKDAVLGFTLLLTRRLRPAAHHLVERPIVEIESEMTRPHHVDPPRPPPHRLVRDPDHDDVGVHPLCAEPLAEAGIAGFRLEVA